MKILFQLHLRRYQHKRIQGVEEVDHGRISSNNTEERRPQEEMRRETNKQPKHQPNESIQNDKSEWRVEENICEPENESGGDRERGRRKLCTFVARVSGTQRPYSWKPTGRGKKRPNYIYFNHGDHIHIVFATF